MLAADKTVTLYHRSYDTARDADTYTRTVLEGVALYDRPAITAGERGAAPAGRCTVRIPAGRVPPGFAAALGDVLALCACEADIADDYTMEALTVDYPCCTVTAVRDRRGRALPHILLEGA